MPGCSILKLELFCLSQLYALGTDVSGDIVASQGNDNEVTQDIGIIHGNGCCIGSNIYQSTSGALLVSVKQAVCQAYGRDKQIGNLKAGILYTAFYILAHAVTGNDIDETGFYLLALHTYRILDIPVAYPVFLRYYVMYLSLGIDNAIVYFLKLVN